MRTPTILARHTFGPTLRLVRGLMEGANPLTLRRWTAHLDAALAEPVPGVQTCGVQLANCSAQWLDVPGARKGSVVLYLHGGAFVTETPHLHGSFLARLCAATKCNGFMPSYRLAPEHPSPAAPDDCLDAYRWLLDQGYEGPDIVLAGDSAGGNLCLGLLPRLRDAGLALPACAVALSPLTDATFSGASVMRNDGLDPMFTARSLRRLAPLYLPDEAVRATPLASPLAADLAGLPPALLLAGSSELLLDDSVRFALKHPDAQLQVWHDMPHTFALFHFLPQAAQALRGMAEFVNEQFDAAARRRSAIVATLPAPAEVEGDVDPPPSALRLPPELPAASAGARRLPLWTLMLAAAAVAAGIVSWLHWAQ